MSNRSAFSHRRLRLLVLLIAGFFLRGGEANGLKQDSPERRDEGTNLSHVERKGRQRNGEAYREKALHGNQAAKCSKYSLRSRRWMRHRGGDMKTAYRMAVLATLAYLQFHKRPLDVTGFHLTSRPMFYRIRLQLCRIRRRMAIFQRHVFQRLIRHRTIGDETNSAASPSCQQLMSERSEEGHEYTFDYWLYDWFEPTAVPGVNYHDTDLLVSTYGDKTLVLAFAGTASAADYVTNIQTFEKATHSGLFHGGTGTNPSIEGSLHRGFLNAFSRVHRGSVLRLCQECSGSKELTRSLDRRYGHCIPEHSKNKGMNPSNQNDSDITANGTKTSVKESGRANVRRKGGCRTRGIKLITILRELVTNALLHGRTVHLSGHSLGGGLATLLALDIVINFPKVPVERLHLWSFGAPQVADDVFLQSAMEAAPRLRSFLERHGNGRFHRFVTLSDDCQVDFVSTVAERALPFHKHQNLRGRAARKMGGVGGTVVHFADPHFLLTPDQYYSINTTIGTSEGKTTTRSTIDAHSTVNYLLGISRESRYHPLLTDLPPALKEWIGEPQSSINAE